MVPQPATKSLRSTFPSISVMTGQIPRDLILFTTQNGSSPLEINLACQARCIPIRRYTGHVRHNCLLPCEREGFAKKKIKKNKLAGPIAVNDGICLCLEINTTPMMPTSYFFSTRPQYVPFTTLLRWFRRPFSVLNPSRVGYSMFIVVDGLHI